MYKMFLQFEHAKKEITFDFVFWGVKNEFRRMIILCVVDSVQTLLSSYLQLIILVLFDNIIVR